MVSTGERVAIGLLCIDLCESGPEANFHTGCQVKILTASAHARARILNIEEVPVRRELDGGGDVFLAGFRVADEPGRESVPGRNRPDGIPLAQLVGGRAHECRIHAGGDGLYAAGRRRGQYSRQDRVRGDPGSGQIRTEESCSFAVEIADKDSRGEPCMPSHIEDEGGGTRVSGEGYEAIVQAIISGGAFDHEQARVPALGLPDEAGIA